MGSKGSQTTTQNTSTAADPQAMAAYTNLLDRAGSNALQSYQAYGGEGVAGVNTQQNTGIGGVNQYAGAAQPGIAQGMAQTAASSAPLSTSAIQQYMSPYTQNVVDATQAQFNDTNNQQLNQVKGNAIAQGAMGGNREAVAETTALKNANIAQAPVIAGLENTGYNNAVNTATQQQQIGLQGANQLGSLGVAGQTAGLQGAGAQIGAGTLQQQTQQALDAYNLQQFQQQQAFPYQQTQWLAGIDTGVGSQMGGTSSGATTAPAPNQTAQWLGTAASAAGAAGSIFSDARIKENIHSIGKLHNGQTIYRFNYKGNPQVHIGLIAQEVEKTDKAHAVHEVNGVKAVDYDAASRAAGGVVQGFAAGGMPGTPYGNVQGYIPQVSGIAHGSGPPHASAPSAPGQQQQNLSPAAIGDMTKNLKSAMSGLSGPAYGGGSILSGDEYGGSSSNPAPGMTAADYGPGFGHGGVAGFAVGGSPDDDTTVINPDDPVRLDTAADDTWRKGVDADRSLGQTAQALPEDAKSSDLPVSQGVAPASRMAFTKDKSATDNLPPEVAQGYSASSRPTTYKDSIDPRPYSDGVAPTSDTGDYWRGVKSRLADATKPDSKLWPSLMSAGFGMMASRSPFLGVAVGEGGQAGMHTYGEEQKREFEAQKVAQQLEHQSREEARQERAQKMQEQQQVATRMNQMIIAGPNGKPIVNPDYITAKQQLEKEWQPKPITIGTNVRGDPVQGYWDPNKKQAYDLAGHPVAYAPNGSLIPWGQPGNDGKAAPATAPAAAPPGNPEPSSSISPQSNNAASPYGKVASLGQVPVALQKVQTQAGYQTPAQAPHDSVPTAPPGTDASRNTDFLNKIAEQDPAYALAIQKAADYELDPGKYASMLKGHRERFINDVLQYDHNYNPQNVGLTYRAQAAYLPGTKVGDTVRAFNTAVSHLDTLKEAYKAVQNGEWQTFNSLKNRFQAEFGYAPPNTLNAIAQIVGGEVVKATVGAQNALGDREELRKALEPKLSQGQALDVIDHFQQLMGGQLHSLKFAYEKGTGLHNFEEKYLLPRSQEVLKHIDSEGSGTGTKAALAPIDQQALDWANANPKDPRADAIKKKLGQ